MIWHSRFLLRELRAGWRQLLLFMACVVLAALSLSVVSGWRYSVNEALAEETKKGAGGDVVAFSTEPFSEELLKAAEDYETILTSEMFTVSLAPKSDRTLFSKLKGVERGYPYFGDVPLESGRNIHEALKQGLVVEKRVLERLEIEVGDQLKLGSRNFAIADVALSEPDRPLGMWGVSPRIFIAYENLESTGLVGEDSYLERRIHFKLEDPNKASEVAESLRQVAVPDQERIETWERPPVNMEKYVKNFFTFLDMMVVLSVALGGLGMQSTLSAWLRGRTNTIAIARTLGARSGFVYRHYTAIVLFCAGIGFALGTALAAYLLVLSGEQLSRMLPVVVSPRLTPSAAVESGFLCLWVSLVFASWPLYLSGLVRPVAVLQSQEAQASRFVRILFGSFLAFSLFGLLLILLADLKRAVYISLGLALVSLLTGSIARALVGVLKKLKPRNLSLRTALGSWRSPEAKSELIIFILSTCLAVLYTAIICEEALRQSWVEAMPPDSPNLLFLDIKPEQVEEFKSELDAPVDVYSNMRIRVLSINGEPLDRSGKREYWDRDGRGKMDALPSDELPENDELVEGETLFSGERDDEVSAREDMAEALGLKLGDRVTFGIQGLPIEATVSSIRSSSRDGFKPSFEMIFPTALVDGAPRTVFAMTRLSESEIGQAQTKIAKRFPRIVSMDISLAIRLIAERLSQMVGLVRYFLASGIVAGVLILISATWSARQRRSRESAFYKVMGANESFLNRVLWTENFILGLACSTLAVAISVGVSYGLCQWTLKVPFPQMGLALVVMYVVPVISVGFLGWLVGRKVISARPAPYLRQS